MKDALFVEQFERFHEEQKRQANPRRLEMLSGDISGTIKMFQSTLWPVFQTFDGFELEYEIVGPNGIRIFIDAYYRPLSIGFECEGFVAHVEKITRERHSFERSRVRTMLLNRCLYVPFSYDELDKKSSYCRSFVYEILAMHGWGAGGQGASRDSGITIDMYEREVIRHATWLNRPIRVKDVCDCLGRKEKFSHRIVQSLVAKEFLAPANLSAQRVHSYVLLPKAWHYLRA